MTQNVTTLLVHPSPVTRTLYETFDTSRFVDYSNIYVLNPRSRGSRMGSFL